MRPTSPNDALLEVYQRAAAGNAPRCASAIPAALLRPAHAYPDPKPVPSRVIAKLLELDAGPAFALPDELPHCRDAAVRGRLVIEFAADIVHATHARGAADVLVIR